MANPLFFCLFSMHFFLLLNQSIFRIINAAGIFLGIQYQPPPEDYNFGHCLLALLSHVAIEGQRPELGEWIECKNLESQPKRSLWHVYWQLPSCPLYPYPPIRELNCPQHRRAGLLGIFQS